MTRDALMPAYARLPVTLVRGNCDTEPDWPLVVDLERQKPIALLPDRSKPTVVQWLKRYPTIKIVARDRSKEFAAAANGRCRLPLSEEILAAFYPVLPEK